MYNLEYLLVYILNYLMIYNLNMIFFITILLTFQEYIKFLNNLLSFNYSNWLKNCLLVFIFSFAGIPPFIFFFYKLNLIYFLLTFDLKILLFLYIIIFISLVFYLQLIRFLLWINPTKLKIYSISLLYSNYVNLICIFLILLLNGFGLFILDDIFLIFLLIKI